MLPAKPGWEMTLVSMCTLLLYHSNKFPVLGGGSACPDAWRKVP